MAENKSNDISIPEHLEKYRKIIEETEKEYELLIKNCVDGFDGADLMLLIGTITNTVTTLREALEDMKEVDGDDSVTIFNIILSVIIEKAIKANDKLSEEDKQKIEQAFAAGGLVQMILENMRKALKKVYTQMDTNKDNHVSKDEYEKYILKSNRDKFGCCGEKSNKNCAKCFTACCFPFLSCCNPKGIKIPK